MVAILPPLREHPVQWLTAAPLWSKLENETDRIGFRQPAILRFTSDTFMDDFLAIATSFPQRLGEWRVQKETWRQPAPIPPLSPGQVLLPTTPDPELENQPLKLYQPAHQRFYLVTANLVCRIPGLPDKTLNLRQGDRVSFVLRRQMQDINDLQIKEHAFVNGVWQPVESDQRQQLILGEQQFPMFPVTYTQEGYQRRMFAGLVPVSGREALLNAGRQPTVSNNNDVPSLAEQIRQRLTVLSFDVIAPWLTINRLFEQENRSIDTINTGEINSDGQQELLEGADKTRDKLQTASWYVLLDFAYFLRDNLPNVWNRIQLNPDGIVPNGTPGKALIEALQGITFKPETSNNFSLAVLRNKLQGVNDAVGATTMTKALRDVYNGRDFLESATGQYTQGAANWPTTKFLLCGQNVRSRVNSLEELVSDALFADPPNPNQRIPLVPLTQDITETTLDSDYNNDLFVIRCVFERPICPPSLHPTVVSTPTVAFQMASYFDPDAPARPIRIPMPVDTTPAGLRKFAKNTMFVVSDTLACQLEKARDLTFGDLVLSVLPWPFRKSLNANAGGCSNGKLEFGKICTFSIPIITICALILLIMIVFLLDIIFKWVPYLIFCLPLPGLKAKKE